MNGDMPTDRPYWLEKPEEWARRHSDVLPSIFVPDDDSTRGAAPQPQALEDAAPVLVTVVPQMGARHF